MLKCIQFVLSDCFYCAIKEKAAQIQEETKPYGVQVCISTLDEMKVRLLRKQSMKEMEHTLYITDDAGMLRQLLYTGAYAIALYHDENREEDFSAALYGVEDVQYLKYRSYDEVYRRLAEIPWDILETERLYVRESTVSDVEDFYQIYRDPSITLYMDNLFPEPEDEKAYMKDYIKQIYRFYGYGFWTVIQKETGKIIGRAGLSVRAGYDLPELGFVIATEYQRKGYGLEVCSAILHYAREELQFDQIQAFTDEKNIASQKLLIKLGFEFDRIVSEEEKKYLLFLRN